MPLPLTGAYAQYAAQAKQAYDSALANIRTQRAKTANRYGYTTDGSIDNSNPYGMLQQIRHDSDRSREDLTRSFDEAGKNFGMQRSRMFRDSGMMQGADGSLMLDPNLDHGAMQRMLNRQTDELTAAEYDAQNRGLGGRGLGAQRAARVENEQRGDRGDFRNQLIDMLTDLKDQEGRSKTEFESRLKDIDFDRGRAEYNLGNELFDTLSGFDQDERSAGTTYRNALENYLLEEALSRISDQRFTTAKVPPKKAKGGRNSRAT